MTALLAKTEYVLDRIVVHYVHCRERVMVEDKDGFDIEGPACDWEGFAEVELCDAAREAIWRCPEHDYHESYMDWGKANGL